MAKPKPSATRSANFKERDALTTRGRPGQRRAESGDIPRPRPFSASDGSAPPIDHEEHRVWNLWVSV